MLGERYSIASNETLILDARVLQRVAVGETISDRSYYFKLQPQIESAEEIIAVTKKGSALYLGFLNLINYNSGDLSDWSSTRRLAFNERIEDSARQGPRGVSAPALLEVRKVSATDYRQSFNRSERSLRLLPLLEVFRGARPARGGGLGVPGLSRTAAACSGLHPLI